MSFTLSTVLYVIPYKSGQYNDMPGKYSSGGGLSASALIFRIILPICLFLACLVFTRFWYLVTWLRPSWLAADDLPQALEGEELAAADLAEAKANQGPKGAARRFVGDNYVLFSVFALLAVVCWQVRREFRGRKRRGSQ